MSSLETTSTMIQEEEMQGLDENNQEEMLVFVSLEGNRMNVPQKIAMMSQLVKTMNEGDRETKEIPLTNIRTEILEKVIAFMTHYADSAPKEIEKPLKTTNLADAVPAWDAEFVEVDKTTLYDLVTAANFMDVKPLLELACAKVAIIIKQHSPDLIKNLFTLAKDLTPEEKKALEEETKFIV